MNGYRTKYLNDNWMILFDDSIGNQIGIEGAKAIGAALGKNNVLTELNISSEYRDDMVQ